MAPTNKVLCHPSWKEIRPNVYTQPYGFQEVLYNAITVPVGSPGLFLVASWVTFSYEPSSPGSNKPSHHDLALLLRQAWLQLRQKYPGLAAENLPDGKVYTSSSSPSELDAWLDATFIVVRDKTSTEMWKNLVKTRYMTMYYLPEEGQLFLQGEHHILDGRGFMNFWDRFFKALTNPVSPADLMKADGSEVARLPPRSDDVLDLQEKTPGRGEQRATEMLSPLLNMKAPIHVPLPLPIGPCSQRNAAFHLKLSVRTTASITAACKSQRLSVTAAWHTAVVLATRSIQEKKQSPEGAAAAGTQFAAFGNFDLRRYFPEIPQIPDVYALGNHHCILPYVLELEDKTYAQMARELVAFYQHDLTKTDADVWSAFGPMVRMLVPDFVRTPLEETTPALSSLGVVDNYIKSSYADVEGRGTWRVDDVWFGDTVMGPWLECFMWTWKGRMCMNTCYNPAYYSHVDVDEFLQLVTEKMLDGLGIDSEARHMQSGSKL